MSQTTFRLDKDLRDALDELANRGNRRRSDVIRDALYQHACLSLEDFPGRDVSYAGANLDEAWRTLGRVISRLQRDPIALDGTDLAIRLDIIRELISNALNLALGAIHVDDRTQLGDVDRDRLEEALGQMWNQLNSLQLEVHRVALVARGRAALPE